MFPLLCRFAAFLFLARRFALRFVVCAPICSRLVQLAARSFLRCRLFILLAASTPRASAVRAAALRAPPALTAPLWLVYRAVQRLMRCGRQVLTVPRGFSQPLFIRAASGLSPVPRLRVCSRFFLLIAGFVRFPWRFSGICCFRCGYIIASELRLFFVYFFPIICVHLSRTYCFLHFHVLCFIKAHYF